MEPTVERGNNQTNDLEHKEGKSIESEQEEEKRIQNNEDRIRNLWDIFKFTNIRIIGVSEGEGEEQEMETFLKT